MSYQLQMSLWFGLGLILEAFVLTGRKFNKVIALIMALSLGLAALTFFVSFKDSSFVTGPDDYLAAHVIFFSLVFAIIFGYILKSLILLPINERYLVIWNLLFLYVYLEKIHSIGIFSYIAFALSLLTIINGFVNFRLNIFWKVFFYAWFLFMLVYFAVAQFSFGNFAFLTATEPIRGINGITAALTGMAFFYIIVHFWYLFRLIPIPLSKTTTFTERINEWKEDTKLMASKYLDDNSSYGKILAILILLGGVLFLNFQFKFLPDLFLINGCIVLIPFFLSKQDKVILEN